MTDRKKSTAINHAAANNNGQRDFGLLPRHHVQRSLHFDIHLNGFSNCNRERTCRAPEAPLLLLFEFIIAWRKRDPIAAFVVRSQLRGERRSGRRRGRVLRGAFSFFRNVRGRLLQTFRILLHIRIGCRARFGRDLVVRTRTTQHSEQAGKGNESQKFFHKGNDMRKTICVIHC